MLLLTRPLPKLESSVQAFSAAGINTVGVATSDIETVESEAQSLIQYASNGRQIDAIIVTSVYAVPSALQALNEVFCHHAPHTSTSHEQSSPTILAVGDATANALKQANIGLKVDTPAQHTSEGILAMHQLNEANCKQVVIIKGEGGREMLSRQLQARGIKVNQFCVYKRIQLASPIYTKFWQIDDVSGIIATSESMAKQLISHHSKPLFTLPWLTVSERIATTLRSWGIEQVAVCQRATDQALIAWVQENWEY